MSNLVKSSAFEIKKTNHFDESRLLRMANESERIINL